MDQLDIAMGKLDVFEVTRGDIRRGQENVKQNPSSLSCATVCAAQRITGCEDIEVGWNDYNPFIAIRDDDDNLRRKDLREYGAFSGSSLVDWLRAHDRGDEVEPICVETY